MLQERGVKVLDNYSDWGSSSYNRCKGIPLPPRGMHLPQSLMPALAPTQAFDQLDWGNE